LIIYFYFFFFAVIGIIPLVQRAYRKSLGRGGHGFLSESVRGNGGGDVSLGLNGRMGGSADDEDRVLDLLRRRRTIGGSLGVAGELRSSVLLVLHPGFRPASGVSGGRSDEIGEGDGAGEAMVNASNFPTIRTIMSSMAVSRWFMVRTSSRRSDRRSSILAKTSRSGGGGRTIPEHGGGGGDGASDAETWFCCNWNW